MQIARVEQIVNAPKKLTAVVHAGKKKFKADLRSG